VAAGLARRVLERCAAAQRATRAGARGRRAAQAPRRRCEQRPLHGGTRDPAKRVGDENARAAAGGGAAGGLGFERGVRVAGVARWRAACSTLERANHSAFAPYTHPPQLPPRPPPPDPSSMASFILPARALAARPFARAVAQPLRAATRRFTAKTAPVAAPALAVQAVHGMRQAAAEHSEPIKVGDFVVTAPHGEWVCSRARPPARPACLRFLRPSLMPRPPSTPHPRSPRDQEHHRRLHAVARGVHAGGGGGRAQRRALHRQEREWWWGNPRGAPG
jgi:hypothetical protein